MARPFPDLRGPATALAATALWAVPLAVCAAPAPAAPAAAAHEGVAPAVLSSDARRLAGWVVAAKDNGGMPFVVIDKVAAKVFVFDAEGALSGGAPALVGLARGDDTVAGIGSRKLAEIGPASRITPAGRFVASLGQETGNQQVLWVDYDAGVALHRVVTTNPKEHRLQRLASASPAEHRISYGCINVPAAFYDAVVAPAFAHTSGVVYILPETRPMEAVFSSFAWPAPPQAQPGDQASR